ncbi:hypothetical protein MBFIL_08770 [Methanobrevibacter filiformis]|uniref:Uncharacterized protein n=1 Tax=Methanobrevibacter filiformis TaxID=55758 RepID=A0A166CFK5_9EURY|nr:hypothetical protein MBFIL_08770 [Methanobrevibacter filiformis]
MYFIQFFSNSWIIFTLILLIIFIVAFIITNIGIIKINIITLYMLYLILWLPIIGLICLDLIIFTNFKVENAISLFVGLIAFLSSIIISLITNFRNKENIQMQLKYTEKIELINKLTHCIDLFNFMYDDPDLEEYDNYRDNSFNKFLFI